MPVRLESSWPTTNLPAVAMVSFARLVKAGLLPAGSKATDALSTATLQSFATKYPGRPAPTNLGDLLVALTGDSDGNQLTDFDVDALGALGLTKVDAAAAGQLDAVQSSQFTQDDFVALAGGHQAMSAAIASGELGGLQQNLWDVTELDASTPVGTLALNKSQGQASLTLKGSIAMAADGTLSPGPGKPGDRVFTSATLVATGTSPVLTLTDAQGSLSFDISPSGLVREQNPAGTARSTEPDRAQWLFDAMLFKAPAAMTHDAGLDPAANQLTQAYALRAQTKPPTDPAERVIWAAAHLTTAQRDTLTSKLTDTWGIRPLKWNRWIDDPSEVNTAKAVLQATGGQTAIRPAYLFTIAMGEGLMFYLDPANDFHHVDTSQGIDGFQELGVDTFATQAADLKRKGLVPAWFTEGRDYTVTTNTNEKGQTVSSAAFPNLESGLVALRAMLADCQNRFRADVKAQLGPTAAQHLTQDQVDYYTYVYFNAGPGFGAKQLKSQGLAAASKWTQAAPSGNLVARYNALQRLSTLKLIEATQAFPAVSPLKAPTPAPAPNA